MPAVAAIGAAVAASASAAGAAAMTALGGLTLSGLATGATIVGAGMQLVGAATGSKTLSKIGMGFSIAGGVGMAAGGLSSMSALSSAGSAAKGAASVTGSTSKSSGLLANGIDDTLAAKNAARASSEGFKTFGGSNAMSNSADSFKNAASKIGADAGSLSVGTQAFDPELEKSYFQRAQQTLTGYNPMMNIMGGMGEAYMMNERMDLDREINDKRIGLEQQRIDMIKQNNGTPLNINPSINLQRDTGAYTGLLRG